MYDKMTRMLGTGQNFLNLIKGINKKIQHLTSLIAVKYLPHALRIGSKANAPSPHVYSVLSWGLSQCSKSNQRHKSYNDGKVDVKLFICIWHNYLCKHF